MQQVLEGLGVALVQEGLRGMGPGGFLLQASQARALEGAQGVVDGAHGTAQVAGQGRGPLAGGAGQEDLTAADGEGVGGAQAGAQCLPFGRREDANKSRWSHTPLFAPRGAQTRPRLLLH
jgi:hypothetical protein